MPQDCKLCRYIQKWIYSDRELEREITWINVLRANQTNCKSKNQLVRGICVLWGTLAILISSSSSWSRLFNLPNLLMFCWSSHVTSVSEPPPFSHSNHENRNTQNQKTEETEAILGDKIEFLLTCCMFDWREKVRKEKNQLHCSLYWSFKIQLYLCRSS